MKTTTNIEDRLLDRAAKLTGVKEKTSLVLRYGGTEPEALLDDARVACYPLVVDELACSNLANRAEILALLQALPEVFRFIEGHRLVGKGLGYIDVHLLASALLTGVLLWTRDKRLRYDASRLLVVSY